MLGRPLRRETMGPNTLAVFPYAEEGAGGCLYVGATMLAPGGQVASPRVEPPPGMGCIAQIIDPAGNRVGLHAEG